MQTGTMADGTTLYKGKDLRHTDGGNKSRFLQSLTSDTEPGQLTGTRLATDGCRTAYG